MAQQTITTYGPELAKLIKDTVEEINRQVPDPKGLVPNRLNLWRKCFAKITDTTTVQPGNVVLHAWKEARWNYAKRKWEDAPDGKKGNSQGNYLIAVPDATVAFDTDDVIEATAVQDPTTGKSVWIGGGTAALPKGQYQYQLYGMVSQNQEGFTFVLAHPMVAAEDDSDEGSI